MKERNINLDLIRCVAAIFVISVHFCLNSGFYELTCSGMRMLIMCILRTAFITCVPLFLMLTGYLMNKKELTISYYKMPGSKGLNPHELAHRWVKDLGGRPDMSIKVGCISHDMRILGRIVGVQSTEQSAGIIVGVF